MDDAPIFTLTRMIKFLCFEMRALTVVFELPNGSYLLPH
jgi:hypothetical protein